MDCSTPGLPVHHQLLEFTHTHVHWVHDAIQPFHPLSSPPPAFSLSQHQGLFKWVSSLHQVARLLEFQLQHQSYQWIFGLISFRIDWLDLLAVQGTLKSLLQHHSSEASILRRSAFFIVQLSHPYMMTGKTIAFTRWTFVCKVMSLLFNMLSRLVFSSKEQVSFNFMASVTICSDFGAQVMSDFFVILWTEAHLACLSMGFSRQEYWSGLHPPPGIFLTQGLNPHLMHWQEDLLPLSHLGNPFRKYNFSPPKILVLYIALKYSLTLLY